MTALTELIDRLGSLAIEETQRRVLELAAERLGAAARANLSHEPGESHEAPWLRSGELRDSIDAAHDDDSAVVGTDSPAAAAQELGTARLPPRPFLGPAAAQLGALIAEDIGVAFAALLQGEELS